jgi:hypothetical protein
MSTSFAASLLLVCLLSTNVIATHLIVLFLFWRLLEQLTCHHALPASKLTMYRWRTVWLRYLFYVRSSWYAGIQEIFWQSVGYQNTLYPGTILISSNRVSYNQGAITCAMPFGSLVGALASSFIADKLSRRTAIQIASVIWVIGSMWVSSASVVKSTSNALVEFNAPPMGFLCLSSVVR